MKDVNHSLQQRLDEAEDEILALKAMVFHLYAAVAESGQISLTDMVKKLTFEANRMEEQFPYSPKTFESIDTLWKWLNEQRKS